MRKLFIMLSVIVFQIGQVEAQTNTYIFKSSTDTYTELTGDIALTQMVFATGDEVEITALNGTTFNLFGKSWTMDGITKGILIFPNGLVEAIDTTGELMVFDGLFRSLDSIDNTSKISYKIDGAVGSKILKAQWKNVKIQSGQAGNFVNLQIWLYQNGIIEYRYGPSSANNASGYTTSTGPSVGIFYSPSDVSQIYQKLWVYGLPPSLQFDSSKTISFPNISGVPANGTVYRFVPKTVAASVNAVTEKSLLNVFPNPANETLNIMLDEVSNTKTSIALYTIDGKLLKEYTLLPNKNKISIQVTDIPTGIYTLQYTRGNTISNKTIEIAH